jgi:hypothetical protein
MSGKIWNHQNIKHLPLKNKMPNNFQYLLMEMVNGKLITLWLHIW